MNPNVSDPQQRGQERVNFKCSDVGLKNCDWQVSGNSEQEIMPKIEQHGLEKQGLRTDDETRTKVRNAIHKQSAKAAGAPGYLSCTPSIQKRKGPSNAVGRLCWGSVVSGCA